MEYKSPDDELTIDVFAKVLAYTHLYKSMAATVDAIPYNTVTATIYRHTYPRELIRELNTYGIKVEHAYDGVYYITGASVFPIQIIVGRELNKKDYSMLRVLMSGALKEDIESFIDVAHKEEDAAYKDYIDKIYQVSITANRELYDQIKKEDPKMCEALRELMKDELEEREARGEARGEKQQIEKSVKRMYDKGYPLDEIADVQEISLENVEKILGLQTV